MQQLAILRLRREMAAHVLESIELRRIRPEVDEEGRDAKRLLLGLQKRDCRRRRLNGVVHVEIWIETAGEDAEVEGGEEGDHRRQHQYKNSPAPARRSQ